MKIKIKNKEVELKLTYRALFIYENLRNQSLDTAMQIGMPFTESVIFMLAVVMASDKTLQVTLDDIFDVIDNDPTVMNEFSDWLNKEMNRQNFLSEQKEEIGNEEKKNLK